MAKDKHPIEKDKTEEPTSSKSKTPTSVANPATLKLSQTGSFHAKKKLSILYTPSGAFWDLAEAKDVVSRSVSSQDNPVLRGRFTLLGFKIDWPTLTKSCIEWFKEPMNIAYFIWSICVIVSSALLFLVIVGLLNRTLPKKSQRAKWYEANNQILNALFTLMCLYQHPQLLHDLFLLSRWSPEDISQLRHKYCKNGSYKPNEWVHMLVVIVLLNLYCFSQYALCGLNLGYNSNKRSVIGVSVCSILEIAAVVGAGVYENVSPLGKEYGYDLPIDEESQMTLATAITGPSMSGKKPSSLEKRLSFKAKEDEEQPKWKGEFFDLCDDIGVSSVSLFCTFCVFGWNMERLGFGNMYVHIVTFMLFCAAPFFIFSMTALTLNNEGIRQYLGIVGILLCWFGLLYGGYWRIKMRQRYNLPRYTFCCGKPDASDCALWFFCCWCSLSQEVRTTNYYDIVNETLCRKKDTEDVDQQSAEAPSGDGATINNTTNPGPSSQGMPSDDSKISTTDPNVGRVEQDPREGTSKPMTPPSPVVIEK